MAHETSPLAVDSSMAPKDVQNVMFREVVITPHWDVTLKFRTSEKKSDPSKNGAFALFKVSKEQLSRNSDFFATMFKYQHPSQVEVVMEEQVDPVAFKIWMRELHDLDLLGGEASSATVELVWEVLHVAHYCHLDLTLLKSWFDEWYANQEESFVHKEAQKLIFPTYKFNHAVAFAQVTKHLAYSEARHVTESNPSVHEHLRTAHRIISCINAARGRLKTVLCSEIWTPMAPFVKGTASCSCGPGTYTSFSQALFNAVEVFPLEQMYRQFSMNHVLDALEKFKYTGSPQNPCRSCQKDFGREVARARELVRQEFQGLCLDCLASNSYWNRLETKEFDKNCRIRHGHTTWYHSYNGRPDEHYQRYQAEKQRRRKRRDSDDYY